MDIAYVRLLPPYLFYCEGGAVGESIRLASGTPKVGCSNSRRDRPKLLKQVVKAPLPNARQQVSVSRVLGDDHYKRMYFSE